MADPLSIAFGIAGLLSLAGSAFHGVHQYVRTVKDAKDFVKALSKELQSLSSILQGVKVLAEAFEQDGTAPSVGLGLEHISSCRTVLDEILKETNKIREAINSQKSITSKVEYVKWPFRKSKTEDLINQLSRHKATLTLALDAASLSALADCLGKVNQSGQKLAKIHEGVENLQVLKQIHLDAQRKDILNFFMPVDPSPNLQTSWKLRHPGTGIWLTESLRFRTWMSEAGSKIWLSGIPGAGKTVLAGAVIREALQQAATGSRIGVAFFFCDYKNPETWDITNILGAIATQLAWQNESAFAKLKDYHDKIKPRLGTQLRPDPEHLHDVISDESEAFDKVFLVIDGLDECGDNAEKVSKTLSDLNQDVPNLSSAFSSRDEAGIREVLQDHFDQISIAAHSEDISLYVGAELEKRIDQGHLRIFDTTLKDEILSRLTSGAQGMFRWVACQLDALGECVTDADRRAALYELPKTLPQTYERILGRVNQKRHSVQRLVRLTLHFLALQDTDIRLSAAQLCLAVSIPEQLGIKWDDSLLVKEQEIARACSSFLRKSADGQYFEFAHFSVREYLQDFSLLERTDLRPYHVSRTSIYDTVACHFLRFLQLKNFDHAPCRTKEDGCGFCTEKEKSIGLYSIAASFWPSLVFSSEEGGSQSSVELLELQKSLLHPRRCNPFLNWVINFCASIHKPGADTEKVFTLVLNRGLSTLHVAAALNLNQVGRWLLHTFVRPDSTSRVGSVLDFSIAGIFAFVEDINNPPYTTPLFWRFAWHSRSSSFTENLPALGQTLSGPSPAFYKGRRLMRIACEFASRKMFLPLKSLLVNGWKLCPEDISIATQLLLQERRLERTTNAEGIQFLDLVTQLNTLGIYEHEEGHKLCELVWGLAITYEQEFTKDTSLLPADITLSDAALIETAVTAVENNNLESLMACEKDPRFNLCEFADKNALHVLHIASRQGAYEVLRYMIDTGCDVKRLDSDGGNFLHTFVDCNTLDSDDEFAEQLRQGLGDVFAELLATVNGHGQIPLNLAITQEEESTALCLLKYHPKQLGCCYGEECIWEQSVRGQSINMVKILKDNDFPLHPDHSDGRPLRSLHPHSSLEKLELLQTLYPNSLKTRQDAKLVLESCLSRWAELADLDPHKMDIGMIRALICGSEALSPTSPAAIDFCCRLVSDFSSSELEPILTFLRPFLEHGIDLHPRAGVKSILETACKSFTTGDIQDRGSVIDILTIILNRVDGKKLNRLDDSGDSILHTVCTAADIDTDWLIPEIVKRGANLNMLSGKRLLRTPLLASLDTRSLGSARTLLDLGADPAIAVYGGWDAAQTATIRGNIGFLRELLTHTTETSTSFDWKRQSNLVISWEDSKRLFKGVNSLHMACIEGHKDCFNFFVDNGLLEDVHSTSEEGLGCLHFVSVQGHVQMLEYLVDLGLDINQTAADGSMPLHMAVRWQHRLCAEILLKRGSLMKKDILGVTPMMYARQQGHDEIIRLLAEYDSSQTDPQALCAFTQDVRNKYWRKAVENAILKKDLQTCSRILEEGCSVNVSLPSCGGCSPLLLSIMQSRADHCELIRLFLDNSAHVCKRACLKHGSGLALFEALRRPFLNRFLSKMLDLCQLESPNFICAPMLVDCIEQQNTDALGIILGHVRDNESGYAQALSCSPRHVIRYLINNYGGRMPLHQAVFRGNLEVVKQLVEAGADVDGQDIDGRTLLQYCQGPGDIAECLLRAGAIPVLPPSSTWFRYLGDSIDAHKCITTQLLKQAPVLSTLAPLPSISRLHPKVLLAVMNSGQNSDAKNEGYYDMMLVAIRHSETATLMLNHSFQLADLSPFPWNTIYGKIQNASWMNRNWKHYLRRFGMEELRRFSNLHSKRGWSPLCLAACTDAINVMQNCLSMGAEVDYEGSPYGSALMVAAGMNRIESVKFLVRHHASILYEGRQGFTSALTVGASSTRVVQWLLVGRFQEQRKLEAAPELSKSTAEKLPMGPHRSWSPTSMHLRLCGNFERQPHESSLIYLKRLARIKRGMRGQVVPLPKPEFLETSVATAIYDI